MLKKYKQQFIGQMAIAEERSNVVMFNMARSFLDLDTIENFDSLKKQVENVSKEQLIACSSSVLNVDNISTLAFLPENH
jgi:predicted Zn-dependent peptidase